MSESHEVLEEIRKNAKGRVLLVGRKIGQEKFDILAAALRVEAKPQKYLPGGIVIAWKSGLLDTFATGDFDSILLHRFLYKRVKEYIEDPVKVLAEVKRILPQGGVLVVNSYMFDDATKNFRSADSFFTEEEMRDILVNQRFRRTSLVVVGDARIFVCEK
jgi:SAM-dependent methyltransferase